mmetsp:Transcript_10959/g.18327  ORF Transcript_10959/g.18327 Transcript_10959/m.18327 type:complete len:176 (-) Transcript_10959:151-678(-)
MRILSTLALSAVGVSASQTDSLKINPLHPLNYLKSGSLLQKLVQNLSLKVNDAGDVTYSQCDDDAGAFILDSSSTSNSPDPIVKDSDLSLNLVGIVSDTIEVTNFHVHVDWNDSTLYDEDHPQDNTYDSTYEYSVKWNVPSYAPSGHYKVALTGTGNSGSVQGGKVLCVQADFDL